MPDVDIHAANIGDMPTFARIWVEANALRVHGRFEHDFADVRQLIDERLSRREATFVKATIDGCTVGIGHMLPALENDGAGLPIPGLMHLSMVAVRPQHWGRGIGKLITSHCIRQASKLGYGSIQLWTHVNNERARRLYASAGFTEAGREKTDERGKHILLYSLTLFD